VTAGFLSGTTPWSLVLDLAPQSGSRNPMAESGTLQFNAGVGTEGLTVTSGQLLTSKFQSDFFWACPNVPVQGGVAMAVQVTNRFATYSPPGCWGVLLYAQCAGSISASDRSAFPHFVQSSCYANASTAR
jgi:hypothetical protein